jgi:ATP-dependent exoDNAse (exonuclease V) beta subunit
MTTATAPRTRTPAEGVHRSKTHQYYFNGQGPWPGVTTITKVLDAPALTNWKMGEVARSAIDNAERLIEDREAGKTEAAVKYLTTLSTTAMDRGSRIHASIESVLRREPADVDPRDEAAVAGARGWLNDQATTHGLRPLEVEAYLISETHGYGGTLDLIAEIDGEVWLLDWKTGKSVAWPSGDVYSDHRLQLAAYAHADFIAKPGDPVRYPLPAVTRFGIVHVTDGGTRLYEAPVTDADWTAFRACLHLHAWRKGK